MGIMIIDNGVQKFGMSDTCENCGEPLACNNSGRIFHRRSNDVKCDQGGYAKARRVW